MSTSYSISHKVKYPSLDGEAGGTRGIFDKVDNSLSVRVSLYNELERNGVEERGGRSRFSSREPKRSIGLRDNLEPAPGATPSQVPAIIPLNRERATTKPRGRVAPLSDTYFPNGLYLDVGDNVHANVCDWLESNCGDKDGQWFIPGECDNGHRIAKIIACGKEWCPVCSKVGSIAHNRRYVRWLPKIMQFKRMRYIVFTIPEELRYKYRTKKALTQLGRQVQELLKKHGFDRGLRRWHWFGDHSHKFHPHLNVLVEGGYLNPKTIDAIRKDYWKIIGYTGKAVANPKFKYKRRPADMAGCLHYMTRATFLDYNWDIEFALEVHNFRNMVVWGRNWHNSPVWEVDKIERHEDITGEKIDVIAIEKIVEKHVCHVCGAALHWSTALPSQVLSLVDKESLGAGYYRIIDRPPPKETSESFALTVRRRCTEIEEKPLHYDIKRMHEVQRKARKRVTVYLERERLWDEILEKGRNQ